MIAYPTLWDGCFSLYWGNCVLEKVKQVEEMPITQILRCMQINLEDFDYCTLVAEDIFAALREVGSARTNNALMVAACLSISFFGSRLFLNELLQGCQLHRPKNKTLLGVVRRISQKHTWKCFTRAFNPNRIDHRTAKRSKFPHRVTEKLCGDFFGSSLSVFSRSSSKAPAGAQRSL